MQIVNWFLQFTTNDLVNILTKKWGKVSKDRFASHTNKKTQKNFILNTYVQALRVSTHFQETGKTELIYHVYLIPKTTKHYRSSRSNRHEVFCKNVFLEILQKFPEKHLCQSLFFNKVASLRPIKVANYKGSLTASDNFKGYS